MKRRTIPAMRCVQCSHPIRDPQFAVIWHDLPYGLTCAEKLRLISHDQFKTQRRSKKGLPLRIGGR